MKTINRALAISIALVALSCHAAEHCPVPSKPVASSEEAVAVARRVTAAYQLSTVPLACLEFKPAQLYAGLGYEITIREVHSDACSGDKSTSPRVASIRIASSGKFTTDAYSPETGVFRPPYCKRRRARAAH